MDEKNAISAEAVEALEKFGASAIEASEPVLASAEAADVAAPEQKPAAETPSIREARRDDVRRLRADSEAIRHAFETGEFPYKTRLSNKVYLDHMASLQVELLKA
jgi:hypothetical protein